MDSMDFSRGPTETRASLPAPALDSVCTAPSPGTSAAAALDSDSATAAAYQWFMRIPRDPSPTVPGSPLAPQALAALFATPHDSTPHDREVQTLKQTVRALQEEKEIAEYLKQSEELKVQIAELHAHTEAQRRKLHELQLLAPTCEVCHTPLDRRDKDGKIEAKASRNATVCSARLGDPACAARRKTQKMHKRRAAPKEVGQTALNDYESTGD